jgi:hypothetical protein
METLDIETILKNRKPTNESLESLAKKKAKNLEEGKEKSLLEVSVEALRKIKENLKLPEKGSLYYPACGQDMSPTLAFPEWDITYLDAIDDGLRDNNKGLKFLKGDLFNPPITSEELFDVVLIISPGEHFQAEENHNYIEKIGENLKEGGFIICNNKHDTAKLLESKKDSYEEIITPENQGELYAFRKHGA